MFKIFETEPLRKTDILRLFHVLSSELLLICSNFNITNINRKEHKEIINFSGNIYDLHSFYQSTFENICSLIAKRCSEINATLVSDIIELIETNYDKKLLLKDIASSKYITPNYLSTIFKDITGTNFSDYLINVRINKAKELLSNSTLKIYEVGEKIGYSDYRYFCKLFRKNIGISPKLYKKTSCR